MTLRDPHWLTLSAYARIYGIDRHTVYKWLEQGLLIHYRVGHVVRIQHAPPPHASAREPLPEQPLD